MMIRCKNFPFLKISFLNNRLRVIALLCFCVACDQSETEIQEPMTPDIVLTKEDVQQWAAEIRSSVAAEVDSNLTLSLWAPDSLLADPVALDMDDYGRAFVTRTNRRRTSEFDIRRHREWELNSISFKHTEDRRAFLREVLTPEKCEEMGKPLDLNGDGIADWRDLQVESEQVYRVEDGDNDGIAETSKLVATGFNEEITDIAGGVLWTEEALYLGVAPDLWKLKDLNGDGVMDDRESLSYGWQVHIGFGGHNLSGVTMGPDGRIYWGIGDIGFNGTDKTGKQWQYPNEGVIARCEPDGSNFEIFAHGLRNTHEFVFDQYGNIISVDNDGDHPGESERLVYIVQDSDQGWRINWQFGKYDDPKNNDYKVWMDEGMNLPRHENQAAYFMPCIRNYINGPTGMIFNPGTALSKAWHDWFFVVEFNGNPARSGIHAFQLEPQGAGMAFTRDKKILSGVLATGMDVGPDGSLYFTDWIDGWEKKGYGRIWKLEAKENDLVEAQQQVQQLLSSDFATLEDIEIVPHFSNEDMRIRQKAQFALVKKESSTTLFDVLKGSDFPLARLHAIWGLGQLGRKGKIDAAKLLPFLSDQDAEVVAQVCKTLGDLKYDQASEKLIELINHEAPRVQYFAMEALGKTTAKEAFNAVLELVRKNDDRDIYLRHIACEVMSKSNMAEAIASLAGDPSRSVRTAAVVALRRMKSPQLANFLHDNDPYIVAEAARAINDDLSVPDAFAALGAVLKDQRLESEVILRRAINANVRVGSAAAMQFVLDFARDQRRSVDMRIEALAALTHWLSPSVVDRVDGYYRGEISRSAEDFKNLFAGLTPLLKDPQAGVRTQALKAISALNYFDAVAEVQSILTADVDPGVRSQALETLVALDMDKGKVAIEQVLIKESEEVRITAIHLLDEAEINPQEIGSSLEQVLLDGTSSEKQAVIAAFEHLPAENVVKHTSILLDQLIAGDIDGALQLNLLELAEASDSPEIQEKISAFRAKYDQYGVVSEYVECLEGGRVRPGAMVLYTNSAAQCLKCHQINGAGGVAGPSLNGVAARLDKMKILQSMVDPSAELAAGYGVVSVTLLDDQFISGILVSESETELIIKDSNEQEIEVEKAKIKERINAMSSMPDMKSILSKSEIRDLMAYLMTLKGEEN